MFDVQSPNLRLLYLNIGNIKRKLPDIQADSVMKVSDIISFNKTHLATNDLLTPEMVDFSQDVLIFCCNCNRSGGGVALIVHKKLNPEKIEIYTLCKIVALQISLQVQMLIISVLRPPSTPMSQFAKHMSDIIWQYPDIPMCVMGDFNEDL